MSVRATFRRLAGLEGATDYVVLVTDGREFKPRDIVGMTAYNEGIVMVYRNARDQLDEVFVPHNFPMLRSNGKYYLGKRVGNNSACQLIDGRRITTATRVVGESVDPDCPGEDLSALGRSHGLGLGFKALYERNIPWRLIIILGVVVVAVIVIMAVVGRRFL